MLARLRQPGLDVRRVPLCVPGADLLELGLDLGVVRPDVLDDGGRLRDRDLEELGQPFGPTSRPRPARTWRTR
jgi:hypothetical protein